jgi:hypothetical protein
MGVPARGPVRAAVAVAALVALAALAVSAGCGRGDRLPQPQRLSQSPPGRMSAVGTADPSDQARCDPDTDPECFPTDFPTGDGSGFPSAYGTDRYGADPYGTDAYGADPYGGTGCPSTAPTDAVIRSEASRLSNGRLPSGVTVADKQCAGAYLVADLTAPNVGTVQLVMRQDGTKWTGLAVGSYLCTSSALAGATDAKTLLNC